MQYEEQLEKLSMHDQEQLQLLEKREEELKAQKKQHSDDVAHGISMLTLGVTILCRLIV